MIQTAIDFAIDAFTSVGLLARQVLTLSTGEIIQEIRIGEGNWSCRIAIAHQSKEADWQIYEDCMWVEATEGPMMGHPYTLTTLLQDGLLSVWQLLGGKHLRNNSLAHLRRLDQNYGTDNFLTSPAQEPEHEQSRNTDGEEEEDPDEWLDTVVFPITDDEKTQPWPIPAAVMDPTAVVYPTTNSQQMN